MRRKKKLRPARGTQQPVDTSFPGTGAPPDPRISCLRYDVASPGKTSFNKVASDQIREELQWQEGRLRSLQEAFPRVTTGTTAELNIAEEQAASKMEARQRVIEALKLELISRGEDPATLAVSESAKAAPEEAGEFQHTEDFRSVRLRGKTYVLTGRQAQVIQILHEAAANGTPDVAQAFILEKMGTKNSRWQDTFRSNREARDALIRPGSRRGTLRLSL